MHENCLCQGGTEERQTKQSNMARRILLTIREYQNFLEESKLVVGVACVACVVSRHFPIFGIMQEYCRRLLVLPDTLPSVEASLVASNRRLLDL